MMRHSLQLLMVVVVGVSYAGAADREWVDRIAEFKAQVPQARVTVTEGRITQVSGPDLANGSTAGASRDAFLNDHLGALGITADQLRGEGAIDIMGGKFTLFVYRQELNGIPVFGQAVKLLVRNDKDHPLVLMNSSVDAMPNVAAAPAIDKAIALATARAVEPSAVNFTIPELVYYPRGQGNVSLTWRFYGDNGAETGFDRWEFFVDAINGTLLDRRPGIYHVDISGTITGFHSPPPFPDQVNNPAAESPVYGARVRIGVGTPTYTDENGDFVLPHSGTDPVTVTVDFVGQWASVTNEASGGLVTGSQMVTPPGPVNITLNSPPTQFLTSQVNAITAVTLVHDFVKSLSPSFTGYDISMPTLVNIDDTCNAGYSPGNPTINFFRAGGGCPNTAYAGVVYHEYGHFIVDFSPGGFAAAGDYHEGMSDVLATLLQDDPCVAHDFFGQGTGCLRNVETSNTQYPCSGGVHLCGQVIGGAFWDMYTELVATEGPEIGLQLARDFYMGQIFAGNHRIDPSVTVDILTLDDDDGEIGNGTPHRDEICTGFGAHNLPCPELVFLTFDYPDGRPELVTPDQQTTIRVNVGPVSGTPVSGTGTVSFRIGSLGSFTTVAMTELSPDEYEATLPAAPCGSSIKYFFSADALGQGTITDPAVAPASTFSALAATSLINFVSVDFESAPGWTVTNSEGLVDGAWGRGIPVGGGDRADPPTDFDGSGQCFLTDNVDGNSDVDGGTTTLISPPFDLTGLIDPRVSYARWYSNSTGSSPFADIFEVEISSDDGVNWSNLETVGPSGPEVSGGWFVRDFRISDEVAVTSQFRIRFLASDLDDGSIVEAGLDAFEINDVECAHCDDGISNQGEDLIDCGGPCEPCECLLSADCSDGAFCSGEETCDGFGQCQPGSPACPGEVCDEINDVCLPCQNAGECDDGVACTVETCESGTCVSTPNAALCDNGLFCDGGELCDALLDCQPGADPCPGQGCNEINDACTIQQVMTCRLIGDQPGASGQILLDVFVENVADLGEFQVTIEITPTSGSGDVFVECPGGISIDIGRSDFVFKGLNVTWSTLCAQQQLVASIPKGGVVVGPTPDYLGTFSLQVSGDAVVGSTFDVSILPDPDSMLGDSGGGPIPFVPGVPCTITIQDCVTFAYGDIDLDGSVDIFDLFCVLNGFSGNFTRCSFEDIDLSPCGGNGAIDIFDLFGVLNAFSGAAPCPGRCVLP